MASQIVFNTQSLWISVEAIAVFSHSGGEAAGMQSFFSCASKFRG
jgi:hypothetical protein